MKKLIFLIGLLLWLGIVYGQNQDCVNAIIICSSGTIGLNPAGIGSDDFASSANDNGCLSSNEQSSAWYTFTIRGDAPPGLDLGFVIDPNGGSGEDYDFAIYGPNLDCDGLGSPLRCTYAGNGCALCPETGLGMGATDVSEGVSGDGFLEELIVNPNETYYLLINNHQNSGLGFEMNWSGEAAPYLDCNIQCQVSVDLPDDEFICSTPFDMTIIPDVRDQIGSVSYSWTAFDADGALISNPNSLIGEFSFPDNFVGYATYQFCVTDILNDGSTCEECSFLTFTAPEEPFLFFGNDSIFCLGELIIIEPLINGNSVNYGQWSGSIDADGFIYTDDFGVGNFTAQYDYSFNGCQYSATFNYEILGGADYNHNLSDTVICDVNSIFNLRLSGISSDEDINWELPSDVIILSGDISDDSISINWNNSINDEICVNVSNDCLAANRVCMSIQIESRTIPSLVTPQNIVCISSDIINISADISPGIFAGPGIIDMTDGVFDPMESGPGLHVINYITDIGCSDSAFINIEVVESISIDLPSVPNLCISDQPLEIVASPSGGTFSGNGIDPYSGRFEPSTAGVGSHMITYEVILPGGCLNLDSMFITVEPELQIPNVMCLGVSLDSVGFIWNSLNGVNGYLINSFVNGIPVDVGINSSDTIYSLSGLNQNDSVSIEVMYVGINACGQSMVGVAYCISEACEGPVPTLSSLEPLCIDDNIVQILASTSDGLFSGSGIIDSEEGLFDPAEAGVGTHLISYVLNTPCMESNSIQIIVEDRVAVHVDDVSNLCLTDMSVVLNAEPSGGRFYGLGIDSISGVFDPEAAGVGEHTILYSLNHLICEDQTSIVVVVEDTLPQPIVMCVGGSIESVHFEWNMYNGISNYILNSFINGIPDEVNLNLSNNSYSRSNLNSNDTVYIEVVYVGINTCGNSSVGRGRCVPKECNINPPIISEVGTICIEEDPIMLIANPSSGMFSGIGVNNVTQRFDPSIAGIGVHTIGYSYLDIDNCEQYNSIEIEVVPKILPPSIICAGGSPNSISIEWDHPDDLIQSFDIKYNINNGDPIHQSGEFNMLNLTGLTSGDTVYIEVFAIGINECGNSDLVREYCIVSECPPSPFNLNENQTIFCNTDPSYQFTGLPTDRIEITCDGHAIDVNGVFSPNDVGSGTYNILFEYTDSYSCNYRDSLIVSVFDQITTPSVDCVNQSNTEVTFIWSGSANWLYKVSYYINAEYQATVTTLDNFITVNNLNSGDNVEIEMHVSGRFPCADSETITSSCIAVECDMEISGIPDQISICDNKAILLEPEISGNSVDLIFAWTTPMGLLRTKDIMALEEGEYTLEVVNEFGCEQRKSLLVIHDPIVPLITISDPKCFGDDDGFIRIDAIAGGGSEYEVSFNGGSFGSAREYKSLSAAEYNLTIRDEMGCLWSQNFDLINPEEFILNIDTTIAVNFGDSLIYNVEVSERTDSLVNFKIWLTSDPNIVCSDCWQLVSVPTYTTTYILNVSTLNGCPGQGVLKSIIHHDRTVYIPNIFRPNSEDSRNQIFQIFTSEEVELIESFQIYNRWGDRIFNINEPYDPRMEIVGWDGIFRGVLATSDVYIYWIKVRFTDGQVDIFKGDVTLLR